MLTNMLKKVSNWSEVHLSEMTCYEIHTLIVLFLIFRPGLILISFLFHLISGDHSLPDVTASTGIKVANKFSNDNVMMQVRGGHFK